MARQRRGIVRTAQDILRRLAEQFRLGRFWSRERGQPEAPERPRLRTLDEIVAAAQATAGRLPPPAQQRWRWSYICLWYDRATGERVGEWRWNIETQSGTNYQQASAQARRHSLSDVPACIQRQINRGRDLVLRCRRIGAPILF